MNRTTFAGALALIALFFTSCTNSGTAKSGDSATAATAVENPDMYHGGGHSVPWTYIQPCIDAYIDTMNRYGINSDSPRQKITSCPDSTYMITTSEAFRADSLMAYLKQQIDKYDPKGQGANLNFVIYPGIRTASMLTAVNVGTSTAGRITYFIVPDTSANPPKLGRITGGGDGSGFEVGGLQP
ncbi:MAG TPA: hypothetical protein VKQ52_11220 [Puia sp.]|nr:hypothetical protein [Puia sp.]